MSYSKYLEKLEKKAERMLEDIPQELCVSVEPTAYKETSIDKVAASVESKISITSGLSPVAIQCLEKISEEVSHITLRSHIDPPSDEHYVYLMKQAGVSVSKERTGLIPYLIDSIMTKSASNKEFNEVELFLIKNAGFFKNIFNRIANRKWSNIAENLAKEEPIANVGTNIGKKLTRRQQSALRRNGELSGETGVSGGRSITDAEWNAEQFRRNQPRRRIGQQATQQQSTQGLPLDVNATEVAGATWRNYPGVIAAGIPAAGVGGYMLGRPSSNQQQSYPVNPYMSGNVNGFSY